MDSVGPNKYPRRPKRLPSLFSWVSPLYFVTFNTHYRTSLLTRAETHKAFLDDCRRGEDFGVRVGEYVMMPDHIQLFVALPELGKPTLGSWIGSLKNVLGKTLLLSGIDKPHWQEGFFDHVIRDEAGWLSKADYMRQNPVRAGLCTDPADWPHQGRICTDLGDAKQIQIQRRSAISTNGKSAG